MPKRRFGGLPILPIVTFSEDAFMCMCVRYGVGRMVGGSVGMIGVCVGGWFGWWWGSLNNNGLSKSLE